MIESKFLKWSLTFINKDLEKQFAKYKFGYLCGFYKLYAAAIVTALMIGHFSDQFNTGILTPLSLLVTIGLSIMMYIPVFVFRKFSPKLEIFVSISIIVCTSVFMEATLTNNDKWLGSHNFTKL